MKRKTPGNIPMSPSRPDKEYDAILSGIVDMLDSARRTATRSVNSIMTATYWEIGRRIVELEQGGRERAGYGEALLERLAGDLGARFGRGFSRQNLQYMRQFHLAYPLEAICQTLSGESQASSAIFSSNTTTLVDSLAIQKNTDCSRGKK